MSIVSRLSEKPWLAPGLDGSPAAGDLPSVTSATVGLRVYLAVASVLFGLIAMMLVLRMGGHGPSTDQQPDWKPMVWPPLLVLNTAVLMLSSAAWEWGRRAAGSKDERGLRLGLLAGGGLGVVFLAGQFTVWRQLEDAGCGITATTMSAFFHLITGLHGLHLMGGLAVWARTSGRVLAGGPAAQIRQSVELCALYWHYLLLIWIVMLGVLLST